MTNSIFDYCNATEVKQIVDLMLTMVPDHAVETRFLITRGGSCKEQTDSSNSIWSMVCQSCNEAVNYFVHLANKGYYDLSIEMRLQDEGEWWHIMTEDGCEVSYSTLYRNIEFMN